MAVLLMISFARATSEMPGSWTRISSFDCPYREILGSATPSSLTRRSIVCSACVTAWSAMLLAMFGFIVKSYEPPAPALRSYSVAV
jgi:hypothetical protein